MPISLPDNPTDGQTVQIGTIIYTYNATVGVWNSNSAVGPTLTPATVTTSDTAPSNPSNGDMWFDSSVGKTFIWYDDGTSTQWVQMNPNTSGGGSSDTGGESPIILTEPPTTHDLNIDGTTSTVTMVAEDPEGFDITYGIVYKTTGNTRPAQLSVDTTINQTSGVYTFTPSSTLTDEGTFRARLSASDGAKTTTRFVDFNLLFAAIQSGYSTTGVFVDGGTTYDYYEFTSDSSFIPTRNVTVEYLLVAGGGDHGVNGGGGGGAGGLLTGSTSLIGGQTYNIVIGQAGNYANNNGANDATFAPSYSGTDSTFNGLTAVGGGGGGTRRGEAPYTATTPANGGSGGGHGGSDSNNFSTGTGVAGQGNNGGAQVGTTTNSMGGGGGGAGSAGGVGVAGSVAGVGGDGLSYNFRGSLEYFSVGGGGGAVVNGNPASSGAGGATCVAGRGGSIGDALDPQNGILLIKIPRTQE